MDKTTNLDEPDWISLQQGDEIAYWTRRFGVTLEQLQQAVRSAGNKAETVEQYLRERGHFIVKKI
jgi:hypothetical protein